MHRPKQNHPHLDLAQASIYKLSTPSTPSFCAAVQQRMPSVSVATRVPQRTPDCIPANLQVDVEVDGHMERDNTQTQM